MDALVQKIIDRFVDPDVPRMGDKFFYSFGFRAVFSVFALEASTDPIELAVSQLRSAREVMLADFDREILATELLRHEI